MSIELITYDHLDKIENAFAEAREPINMISPFIGTSARMMADAANRGVPCTLITRFYRDDFINGMSNLQVLKDLAHSGVNIYAVNNLHTKLYLFGRSFGIVGSANFTYGGLVRNLELSLAVSEEEALLSELNAYFAELLTAIGEDFRVSEEQIDNELEIVIQSIRNRDKSNRPNPWRFGAELDEAEESQISPDPVEELVLARLQGTPKALLKFEGRSSSRADRNSIYQPAYSKSKAMYFTCASHFPKSITSDKTLFLCSITSDEYGHGTCVVVGRARAVDASRDDQYDDEMRREHPWIVDYPYYVEIHDIEVIDTEIANGISLISLIQALGNRLYPNASTKGATPASLKHYHAQKSYIHITPEAEQYINAELDRRFTKYGKRLYGAKHNPAE